MEMLRASLLQRPVRAVLDGSGTASREAVAAHLSARAHGIAAAIAHRRTMAFYRSSGGTRAQALG